MQTLYSDYPDETFDTPESLRSCIRDAIHEESLPVYTVTQITGIDSYQFVRFADELGIREEVSAKMKQARFYYFTQREVETLTKLTNDESRWSRVDAKDQVLILAVLNRKGTREMGNILAVEPVTARTHLLRLKRQIALGVAIPKTDFYEDRPNRSRRET